MESMRRILLLILILCFSCNLVSAQEPELVLPIGHTNKIFFAQFSPDQKKVLTVSADATAKIWDAASGAMLVDLKGHSGEIRYAQFSPDGKKIVTASGDKTAKIWDAASGNILADLKEHTAYVRFVQFSPACPDDPGGGKKIVTASWDSTAKIWDAASGKLLVDLRGHSNALSSAHFSPDGKKIVTSSDDSTAKVWDAASGKLLANFKGHNSWLYFAEFSPDGKKIITTSQDSTAKIWDAVSGVLLADLKGHSQYVWFAQFSPDGKKIVTVSDKTPRIWDAATGAHLYDLKGHSLRVYHAEFSPDGKKIATASNDSTLKIWSAVTGALLTDLKGHSGEVYSAEFSRDGKKIVSASGDRTSKIWDVVTGAPEVDLMGHNSWFFSAKFSPDGKRIVTASADKTAKIWDAATGALSADLKAHIGGVFSAQFSPDGKKIVTSSLDYTAKVWDAATGLLLTNLKGHKRFVPSAQFSPDGKKIITASYDTTVKIWDAVTGLVLLDIKGHSRTVTSAQFSPACPDDPGGGKKIVTASWDSTAKVWDADGALVAELKGHTGGVLSVQFSPDGKKIVSASSDQTAKVWDVATTSLLVDLKGHAGIVGSAQFSPDGKKIVTASADQTAKVWDAAAGSLLVDLKGHTAFVNSAQFSPDGKKIITASGDNTVKIWNAETGEVLYTFFTVDSADYLIVDKDNHYDGTQSARKLLYFTCGTETISLEQVKDQLWVPNLAERINKGETINAQKLSDLNICNLTPLVDTLEQTGLQYRFYITPRLGGLGVTIVYVNGIEVNRYTPQQLKLLKGQYQLFIDKKELQVFFASNKENLISVKSLTAKSSISSRSVSVSEKRNEKKAALPNLYAVVVGVSDYKGEGLDLKFAAKDAVDMANAIDASAKKLLNTDGREHVFIYKVHTGAGRDKFPEKNSIRQLFTEIAGKAQPNDILLVFFAGHGVMESEKNQFYFLTADASNGTVSGALKNVGISTEELTDWIKPQSIKAQKRILILDACNSGQAIKEIISFNQDGKNLLASRGDEKGKQAKAIEKLNEKSGMFILSASAGDQKAYEMGKFNQGVLTYSLLKAIKEEPDILEDRQYLNISRWFNAAEKSVVELARETGARQQPQVVSTTNFNIGVVDEDVRNKIVLPFEKFLFTRSEFRNAELKIDNLKLRSLADKELNTISENGGDNSILFNPDYEGANVYAITGDYSVTGDNVTVTVLLTKGGTEILHRYEIKGTTADLNRLTFAITSSAIDWISKSK